MLIATIDAGTTNTRTRIWQGSTVVGEAHAAVGVRNTAIDGNNHQLLSAIHTTLVEAAQQAGVAGAGIELILAAGMLTSNVGIVEIPHVAAPVTMEELAAAMVERTVPAISAAPIWFVPGIKNLPDQAVQADTISAMDIMRGEETEMAGLLAQLSPQGPAVIVLPGSHNKYISLDGKQRVLGCMTTLTGELLHSLTLDTILASSVQRGFASCFDAEAFTRGVHYRENSGLGHAAFMARILDLFEHYTAEQAQNYLLGILLEDDLLSLQGSHIFNGLDQAHFIIAGKAVMQQAYAALFGAHGWNVQLVGPEQQQNLSGLGAISLAKKRGLVH